MKIKETINKIFIKRRILSDEEYKTLVEGYEETMNLHRKEIRRKMLEK